MQGTRAPRLETIHLHLRRMLHRRPLYDDYKSWSAHELITTIGAGSVLITQMNLSVMLNPFDNISLRAKDTTALTLGSTPWLLPLLLFHKRPTALVHSVV